MKSCKPDKDIQVQKIKIDTGHRKIPALILTPKQQAEQKSGQRTCVLWLHGGGYIAGMKEMVYMSRAVVCVLPYA